MRNAHNFFPVKVESLYFSTKTRVLPFKTKRVHYSRKKIVWFSKNFNFVKNRKNARKTRVLYILANWRCQKWKKRIFFSLPETDISKMKRCNYTILTAISWTFPSRNHFCRNFFLALFHSTLFWMLTHHSSAEDAIFTPAKNVKVTFLSPDEKHISTHKIKCF